MTQGTGRMGVDAAIASFRRRKWVALSVFALVLSAALTFAKSLPNLYQSTAIVLVEHPSSPNGEGDVESRLQSIRQEILSRTRLAELIGRLDLYPEMRKLASMQTVVERMRRDVRIDVSGSDQATGRGTIAFSLGYRGRDPVKVTVVANALTNSYLEEDTHLRDRQTSGAAAVLRTQLEEVKKRLAPQEAKIAEFKRNHAGELPQQADASLIAVERLSGQLQRVSEMRTAAVERRATLLRESGEPGQAEAADPDRVRLARLTQELAAVRTKFSEKYPDVIAKKSEVESLSLVVAQKPVVDRSLPQLEQLNREIRTHQAEESRLRSEIGMLERRVAGAPFREQEYSILSRDYATTRDFYDSLLKRYEEAQLAEAREDGPQGQRLRLLDPAITPVDPIAPDRLRLAIFGLIAALALAVVGVAAAERFDTSFHSAEDLARHTRVPVLVRIPRMPNDSGEDRTRSRRQAALMTLGLVTLVFLTVNASRMLAHENEGVVALLAPRSRS